MTWSWNTIETPLQWRQNGHDGISNHQPHDCLLNRLFRHISRKTPKPHVTGLCAANSLVTGEFPTQMASNAENVSIWWRHHDSHKFHFISLYIQDTMVTLTLSIYNTVPLWCSQFFQKSSQQTPHSSPMRLRYGVSFVSSGSELCSAAVIAVLFVISWYIWQCYDGDRLYKLFFLYNV